MAQLFGNMKDKKAQKTLIELLTFIAQGTLGGAGHAMVPLVYAKEILKREPTFIKLQREEADPAGNVPVYATSVGITASGVQVQAASAPVTDKELQTIGRGDVANLASVLEEDVKPSSFQLFDNVPVPPQSKRGGLKGEKYPFALMKVGQSFIVPKTVTHPNPAKGLASTVSSANRRFAANYPATKGADNMPHPKAGQPTGKDGRTFTVRAVEAGAQVWRIT